MLGFAATEARAGNGIVLKDVRGLRHKLEIRRDRQGVPHINAQNEPDAILGLGFVHAQDRLWQLEFLRRLGKGRLAEVLGPPALDGDKLFRILGITQSASATWGRYKPEYRELILSYVAGLNAATERQRVQGLPPEFVILNFEPEPWTPEDVMVMAKTLGWIVDGNWSQELLRAQLQQVVGPERAAELMPAYTPDGPIILPDGSGSGGTGKGISGLPQLNKDVLAALLSLWRKIADRIGAGGPGNGSNNQVLAGSRTTTRRPILAADPHLPSQIPSIFYRVHVSGGRLNAIGATAVGIPGILMGHNGLIAWGWTNANADVQDLYVERILDGGFAEYNGAREPLQMRPEVIKVKGAADVALTVRSTRHGPLISDLVAVNGPALALRWAALDTDDDIGVAAYLEANKARTWGEFTNAFRKLKAHAQNLVYGDIFGNIAYVLAGTIPIRAAGDGSAPVPGWTSAFEWTGYIPFDQLPVSTNPRQGFLASSNNRIAPASYPHTLGTSFAAPYRAMRVRELLNASSRLSMRDLENIQADVLAVHARELLPTLLSVTPANDLDRKALDVLRQWDYRMTGESAAAAVFEAWYIQLAESLFADELGPLWQLYSDQLQMVSMALSSAIRTESPWCDDVRTPATENCSATASAALSLAMTRMSAAQGTNNVAAWQWSKVHRTVFFHQPFGADPVLGPRFNRITPNGGDKHTVNVASNPAWNDYDQRHLALYRQIIDLGNFANSRWMAAPGQSGIVTDRNYDDLIEDWRRVDYKPMIYYIWDVLLQTTEEIELRP